jgi:tRNA 2-thiouridine synthesizing protein E
MSIVELVGKKVELDDDGYLKNPSDWSEEMAKELASEEGISELTDQHWAVINLMRKEYLEKGDAPSIRRLTKESGVPVKDLYQMFPKGPAKKAARIAGIPKPTGCV